MNLTYRQLLNQLQNLNDEQLDSIVTLCDYDDEFFALSGLYFAHPDHIDTLDPAHPYLIQSYNHNEHFDF